MELINKKYYDGFEGEPEIHFIYRKGNDIEIFVIWEGYFDSIMRLILPERQGWVGLAYCYNMYTGWYNESPWMIDDLQMALKQFESIDSAKLCKESNEVLMLLCNIFKEAILNNYSVSIVRE
ncbi:MAG: dihydroorotate dehydrogenase (quinone) [Lachnospiraceae bacterium]|nr:dihydroorotate dehydrogenase (quinone) [Lachnospiraceae bacterium]